MTTEISINIPTGTDSQVALTVKCGQVLYLLGANGTGKSSLVTLLYNQNSAQAERISAHRQTWFESNTLNMTARNRQEMENNFRVQDVQIHARYRDWNPAGRSNMAIFDLIDADTMLARKIADLVRKGDDQGAKAEANKPSPLQIINELMKQSNLSIEIKLKDGQHIVAQKNGGTEYSVAEMSDGERNAFLIAAEVLTAKPETLILIDEPERHLHRSIVSPLLNCLFHRRQDCAFIVSTHDVNLPLDTPNASTLLVRNCEYQGHRVNSWTVDLVEPGAPIDEKLKRDLLGSRRKMLFVEGISRSLDAQLYSILFPQISIIPKESCREVEHAVKGLRSAPELHWISAWGIVDNDQRPPHDIARLRAIGVWALCHYSVEALYYHPIVIAGIADRQSLLTGADPSSLVSSAMTTAVLAVQAQKEHFVSGAVLRKAREAMMNQLPRRENVSDGGVINFEVNIATLRTEEEARFDEAIANSSWEDLLARYPLRESAAFDRIIAGLKIADRPTYVAAVLKMLQDDFTKVSALRGLLGDLPVNMGL